MNFFRYLLLALLLPCSFLLSASEQASPYQVVEETTTQVTAIIEQSRSYYDEDPERYYAAIGEVLANIVDFDSFARSVMGRYASKKEYDRLASAEEKPAYLDRMKRFSDVFRGALIETYAKGLLAFSSNRIEILPPEQEGPYTGSVTVVQHIYGEAEQPYEVLYKMRRDKAGNWKLRNVTIEAVNLGKVYQNQFASAVKQYNGDVDKVIETWVVAPVNSGKQANAG